MNLTGVSIPLHHLSATSLAKAITCPELWRRRYLQKEPERMFSGRFMGIVDHATHAENFTQKIVSGEDLDLDWMKARYKANWDTEIRDRGEPDWADDEDPTVMQQRGMRMVEAYHRYVSPFVQPVRVEERFEEVIDGVPIPIIGYMDTQAADRIVERKTSNKKVSKPKPEWRFQARVYQLVADLPTEWHVVTSQAEPRIYTPETDPALFLDKGNPDAIVRVIQQTFLRLEDLYNRYGPDRFWPTEGLFHPFMCDYCGYKNTGCPAWIVP